MKLAELQKRAAAAIMAPMTASDGIAAKWRREADALIKPNQRMAPIERLEIYSRSYWFRVLDCLRDDFPGLRAALGQRAFQRLSRAYLAARPSQSFSLRNLGAGLEKWLRENPQYAGRHLDLALDMVRLEWAHIQAFDGQERKPLGPEDLLPEDLLEFGPELKLDLQPHLTLLEVQYPVDDLRLAVNASAIRRYRRVKPQPIHVAVYRAADSVWYRRLDAGEYCVLDALRQGLPMGEALEKLPGEPLSAAVVQEWFAAWARMGWLCGAVGALCAPACSRLSGGS